MCQGRRCPMFVMTWNLWILANSRRSYNMIDCWLRRLTSCSISEVLHGPANLMQSMSCSTFYEWRMTSGLILQARCVNTLPSCNTQCNSAPVLRIASRIVNTKQPNVTPQLKPLTNMNCNNREDCLLSHSYLTNLNWYIDRSGGWNYCLHVRSFFFWEVTNTTQPLVFWDDTI